MALAGGDGGELARWRIRPPVFVGSPADGGLVGFDGAGVALAGGDGGELTRRRSYLPVPVGAPAGGGLVGFDGAGVPPAGGDGGELARRRIRLAVAVGSPAGDGLVGSDPARVIPAVSATGGDGGERRCGGGGLAEAAASGHRLGVDAKPAAVDVQQRLLRGHQLVAGRYVRRGRRA